jgi:hypothetical protein
LAKNFIVVVLSLAEAGAGEHRLLGWTWGVRGRAAGAAPFSEGGILALDGPFAGVGDDSCRGKWDFLPE